MSENENSPESNDEQSSAAPEEVDAEIVEDGYGGGQSGEPETAGADTGGNPGDGAATAPNPPNAPSKRIYIAIAAIAAVAVVSGLVWLGVKPKSDPGAAVTPAPASTDASTPEMAAPESSTPEIATGETILPDAAPLTLDIAPKPDAAPTPDAAASDKIFNNGLENAKDAFEALSDAAEANDGDYLGMPEAPPADAFGNAGLQQAAKDAAKLLKPDAPAETDAEAPAAGPDDLNEGDATEDGNAVAPSPDPQQGAAIVDPAIAPANAIPVDTDKAAAKIDNDFSAELDELKAAYAGQVEALGDALAREREITQAQSAEIARLNAALAAARARAAPAVSHARAALALTALTDRALAGEPYLNELEAAREAGAPAAAIAALAPHAQTGAPTLASLKQGFDAASRAALAAGRRETAQGPMEALGANLAAYVNLRPAAPTKGDSAPAVISRAQEMIDNDDVAGAAAEVQKLEGAAREAFSDWLADANVRAQISAALSQANATVMSRLADGAHAQ